MKQHNSPLIRLWRQISREWNRTYIHIPKSQRQRMIVGRKFNGKLGWQPIFKTLPRI